MSYQTAHVVESLKQACSLLEPHGLVMVLEPLNFRDHPGLFLSESPQAYEICKTVDSPSCKILFDIYHQQIQEGNLIPNINKCWDEIGYFQIETIQVEKNQLQEKLIIVTFLNSFMGKDMKEF